jgi:hypothetical protein
MLGILLVNLGFGENDNKLSRVGIMSSVKADGYYANFTVDFHLC